MQQSRGEQKIKSECLQALKGAQRAGKLGGIIGRVGDLGTIDEKYDVAATTASAGTLEWIAVDTEKAAQDASTFLRQHQIGRASFMIMERINA